MIANPLCRTFSRQGRIGEPLPAQQRAREAAGNNALEYRVYDSFAALQQLKPAWDDLAGRHGDLFGSYDWCETWWRHFGRDRRLEIHTLHDGHCLVAVLPLFRETIRLAGVGLRTVRVVGCDYTISTVGLVIEPAYVERFTRRLLQRLDRDGSWDVLQIGPLRCYAAVAEPMGRTCAQDPRVQTVVIGRRDNWDTLFHLPDTYERFEASLPGTDRKTARRRERQLHERHRVEVSVVTDPEQVQPAMDILIQLHQKRWVDRGQTGQFAGAGDIEAFHREVAQRLAETGQLVLLTIKADDQFVAATCSYFFGRRMHNLFVGYCYDPPWQRYGLGRITYGHLIRRAIAHGVRTMEDGRGIFEHKLHLGGRLYGEQSLLVIRRGWSARLRCWLMLRIAYVLHVLGGRIWMDFLAPRLGITPRFKHSHQRIWALAQIFRRARFPLLGGPRLLEGRCVQPAPAEHLGDPADQARATASDKPTGTEGMTQQE